jgi:hypothetical protein
VFPDLGYDASQTGRAPRVGNSNISIDVFRRCSFEAYIDAELAEAGGSVASRDNTDAALA